MPVARLSAWAALACKNPAFQRFLQVDSEPAAVAKLRALCGIESRRELDSDTEAAQRFHEVIRKPYIQFTHQEQSHV